MAPYELRFKPSVLKDLRGIPQGEVGRILARIDALRDEPRSQGAEKLWIQDRYRVRIGNYRILYVVADIERLVEIIKIGHRRDVYR